MGAIGTPELTIILVLVVILFGVGKLPTVMRDVGAGIREMRKAVSDEPKPDDPA